MATKKELEVENWNLKHEVGTRVRYWPGVREGEGKTGVTTHEASLLGGHTPCVYVRDDQGKNAGAIALDHIEVIG